MKKLTACLLAALLICLPTAAQALSPSDEQLITGMDVSLYQGTIDYAQVKQAGIQAVYIRAGQGPRYTDPYFAINYQRAKDAGLWVGMYHYVTATNETQAREQARHFAQIIDGYPPDMRPAIDLEYTTNPGVINRVALAFYDEFTGLTGYDMVLYSNAWMAANSWSREVADTMPLWVANYDVSQPGSNDKWDYWVGWQYTSSGSIPGISGNVDLDHYTRHIFLDETPPAPAPAPSPTPSPDGYLRVTLRPGDTLWDLAITYHSTVAQLAAINNIANPNLIYAGETILVPNGGGSGYTMYTVRYGDTLWAISLRYNTSIAAIAAANNIPDPNLIYPGQVFRVPVNSR